MRESERQSCAAISAARSGSCDLAHSVSASTWRRRRRPWARACACGASSCTVGVGPTSNCVEEEANMCMLCMHMHMCM